MKRTLPFLSIAVVLTACGNNTKTSTDSSLTTVPAQQIQVVNSDTTGLAEFQSWKTQQEAVAVQEPANTVSYVTAPSVKKTRKAYKPASTVVEQHAPVTEASTSENTVHQSEDVAMNTESSNAAEAPEKKGWSKAAKGAVIGGASGAAAGAVINKKNRVVGAVIGGVLGAGGGYVIGRDMDKKDGRY